MTCTKIDIQAHPRLSRRNKTANGRITFPLSSLSLLNTADFVYQSRYTSLTLRQSTTLQRRFKYSSLPHTPKPALIHACSWTLKHMSGMRSSPALRRSLTMPSCLLDRVGPTVDEIARCRVPPRAALRGRRGLLRPPLRSLRLACTATTGSGGPPQT